MIYINKVALKWLVKNKMIQKEEPVVDPNLNLTLPLTQPSNPKPNPNPTLTIRGLG